MASYGFEFVFPNIYFSSTVSLADETLMFTIKNNDVLLYNIKAVHGKKVDEQGSWHYSLKAVSVQNTAPPSITMFAPLTALLQYINTKITNNPTFQLTPQMAPFKIEDPNAVYVVSYVNSRSCVLKMLTSPQSPDNTEVHPQFTFGFDAPSTLPAFYQHFDPVTVLDMNRITAQQPEKGCFARDPYSGSAEALFNVLSYSLNIDASWADFWYVLEFLRLSLGFSMAREITQDDTNRQGNKAYMRIMARTSFRSMFQNIIPLKVLDLTSHHTTSSIYGERSDQTAFDIICFYIDNCFQEPFQRRTPFWHLSNTPTLAGKAYMMVDPKVGNIDLVQYYRDKTSIRNIVASTLLPQWQTEDLSQAFTQDMVALFPGSTQQAVTPTINQIQNNLVNFDLMSPVPYSLPNDAMGYYSRASIPGTPKFLLEVQYIEKFYELKQSQPKCLYNTDFQTWCVGEFLQAQKNWTESI